MSVNIELNKKISLLLDVWDPLGINNVEENVFYHEYDNYIVEIVKHSYSRETVYNYLLQLYANLLDEPDIEGIRATEIAANHIFELIHPEI